MAVLSDYLLICLIFVKRRGEKLLAVGIKEPAQQLAVKFHPLHPLTERVTRVSELIFRNPFCLYGQQEQGTTSNLKNR